MWTWNRIEQNRRELLAQKAKEQESTRIEGLVGELISAEPSQLPGIVKNLPQNPEVSKIYFAPILSTKAITVAEKRSLLHARMATVSSDKSLVEPLLEELLTNKIAYIGPIRQQLRLYALERIPFGQRRANSAITMLRLGEREKVLPVFDFTEDPEALSQFIFRCRDRGVRVEELLARSKMNRTDRKMKSATASH